jgi:hypothetical protein
MNRPIRRRPRRLAAALPILLLLARAPGLDAQLIWGPTSLVNGPGENRPFGEVACDPVDPDVVWALTSNLPDPTDPPVAPAQGVFKSTDGGVTWAAVNDAVLRTEINALDIAISASDPNVVYLATNVEGIFKTTDGGATWAAVNAGIVHNGRSFPDSGWAALAVAVDPTDPDLVYCGVANANNIDLLSGSGDHPGFYRSTDGGASWSANNAGLPPRYDPIDVFDAVSHTATVASIVVIPQNPNIVVIGMSDQEVNANLFGNRTASTRGRMFFSTNRGAGSWSELSTGLPQISEPGGFLDLARVSASQLHITAVPTGVPGVYASHIGVNVDVFADTSLVVSASRGVYRYEGGSWVRRSNGLPVVTDGFNDGATNAGPVAISPVNPDILLVGVSLSDSGNPGSERSKVYATATGGTAWTGSWDSGMSNSPVFGFTESNVGFVALNADQSAAFASVVWGDGTGEDDGIYRLPPP